MGPRHEQPRSCCGRRNRNSAEIFATAPRHQLRLALEELLRDELAAERCQAMADRELQDA
jgi:hypothetical protein